VTLLEPRVEQIAPEPSEPSPDRAPDWVADGTPEPLRGDLIGLLREDRVLTRAIDLVRYASDASPYRLIPKVVVMAKEIDDVAKLLGYARRSGTPVTFRAGGTSLNGQAQSGEILVDVREHWRGIAVEDGGERARVGCGTVLGHANRVLGEHGRKLGPDPASTEIACVGGVIANNSGGMRCGVVHDSYMTVRAMKLVLASGTVIDTAAPDAERRFASIEPELAEGLVEIRDEIRADAELADRIRRKFEIKNTTGYRLCAFLDADSPLEIFRRLVVGSEGTLAFVAEATFETVPVPPLTTCSWLHFPDIPSAVELVPGLVDAGASAVELMVAPALIVASHNMHGTPEEWRELPPESAALLVEFPGDGPGELDAHEKRAAELLAGHDLIRDPDFTRDPETIEMYWRVREGLHGLIGKMKPPEAALIIEDVCVPPRRIAESAEDIRALLGEHGFLPGVAGHASAGNLHFMLTPDFSKPEDVERYEGFMSKLVELVLDKYDGSLKAEHGTGINMAPYVEREWGEKATELMWKVKRLADPDGVLAPGVVLNREPGAHLRNLRTNPMIEEAGGANSCVECGFCEPVCPSRWLTTTPRQRIVLRREMARQAAGSPVQRALIQQYEYDGIETCAADGTCALICPVGIDAGKLIKDFRGRESRPNAERMAVRAARSWAALERSARGWLRAGSGPGRPLMRGLSGAARALVGDELMPAWPANMPRPAPAKLPRTEREGAAAVYLPACVNRIFGRAHGDGAGLSLPTAVVALSARAGAPVWIPPDVAGHCCAVPWSSKGYAEGQAVMATRTVEAMWRWSGEGELPIVTDASSCALGLAVELPEALDDENSERHSKLEIRDSIAWVHDWLLPELEVNRRLGSVALHPACAARHLGLGMKLGAIAEALAGDVTVPRTATCCGFAGDRGMLHPELTAAATADIAAELGDRRFDAHLCSNRTCEIGLQQGTGRAYESFVFALEQATRPVAA
jgi:D-lactate dehydrogenase